MLPSANPSSPLPRHAFLQPDVWQALQERQRVLAGLFVELGWTDLSGRQVVEVGCGAGGNLLELLRMGFMPRHLTGIEIDRERHAHAREVLPASLRLIHGDALVDEAQRMISSRSQDIVLQATVFSSILKSDTQAQLAETLWRWVRPGGGVLWYDFAVDNPRNPNVRGVPLDRVRGLSTAGAIEGAPCDTGPASGARGVPAAPRALPPVQCAAMAAHAPPGLGGQVPGGSAGHPAGRLAEHNNIDRASLPALCPAGYR